MKLLSKILLLLSLSTPALAGDIDLKFNYPVEPPAQQANLEQMTINAIKSAKVSLDVNIYDLDLVSIATEIGKAHAKGIKVRLVTDSDNNLNNEENHAAYSVLNEYGVPWIDDTEDGTKGSGIQHNKYIIIDSKRVLFGSTNFTQSGMLGDLYEGQRVTTGNVNHILIVKSKQAAAVFQTDFDQMWGDGPGGAKDSKFGARKLDHEIVTVYTDREKIRMDIQFSPWPVSAFGEGKTTLENMEKFVSTAQDRIYVAQFAYSAQNVGDAIYERHKAGVDVKGVGDSNFFFQYWSEFLDMIGQWKKSPYQPEDNGMQGQEVDGKTRLPNNVWEPRAEAYVDNLANYPEKDGAQDKFHHKYVVVDDAVLTGSHNISSAGAFSNDEVMVIIYDKATTDQFASEFMGWFNTFKYDKPAVKVEVEGTWDDVYFTGEEVGKVLNIVNSYTQEELDAFLDARAARNIASAQPISSMVILSSVPYVGKSTMTKLKEHVQ